MNKISKSLLVELDKILSEDYDLELDSKDLTKLAYSLVGYFDLLAKVENRHEFQNRPGRAIDTKANSGLDKKEEK
jgi:hypothetical protein